MSKILCKLVFRRFLKCHIDSFHQLCKSHPFQHLSDFDIASTLHLGDDNDPDATDAREETEFSFVVPQMEGDKIYQKQLEALCELMSTFETFQKNLRSQDLPHVATVCMVILSRDVYPQEFELVNTFNVQKIVFGSIVCRRFLSPSLLFYEPKTGEHVFNRYLTERRDFTDPHGNMMAFFEHDRDSFTVCFPDIIKPRQTPSNQNGIQRSNERVVDIRVSYSSIRRLIVTLRNEVDAETGISKMKVNFTFQISNPPFIYINELMAAQKNRMQLLFKPPTRCLTWNNRFDVQNAVKYGSALVLEFSVITPRELFDCLDRLRKKITHAIEFRFLARKKTENIRTYFHYAEIFMNEPDKIDTGYAKLAEDKYFPLVYAIQAIISRGGEVFDYFFRPEFRQFKTFLDLCIEKFESDLNDTPKAKITKTVLILESMLQQIDKLNDIPEIVGFFQKLYDESGYTMLSESDLEREGYVRVRKILITPSRKLFVNPEFIMGNRFLRKHGSEMVLRILFRDDDGFKLSCMNSRGVALYCVRNTLLNGLSVGGKMYTMIGSSCSQLRDNGCYFVQGTVEDADELRKSMGRFKIEPVPKMMARVGQVFTQSKVSRVRIERNAYNKTADFEGGANSQGKPYCFSDGVGVISLSFATRISKDLNLNGAVPSCFQFRFRGFKGVLSVSPALDAMTEWLEQNGNEGDNLKLEMQLRPSQEKFKGPREDFIEIVKYSAPSPVSLNKPMLNIMDQISRMQSEDSHERMIKRIHHLLNVHINRIMGALNNEKDALSAIAEFPKLIMADRLSNFHLAQEPFFRSLLRSWAKFMLAKLTTKMRISIPSSLGRSLFGICDESGLLQSGQVFVRYTTNCYEKLPQAFAEKVVLVGKVLVTKNPAVVGGDVRVFEAVDVPALRYLSDVIVFPRVGPRPHPDEMAGSDLDGDEYTIIWDPELLLDYNETAFDYSVPAAKKPGDAEVLEDESDFQKCMIGFFINYISQDAIGLLSNAHLANSDLYGINSEHCNNIALKHNQAVDFPKTGIAPPRLRSAWIDDMPPERVERWPDFMGKKQRLGYRSTNLMGDLYRAVEHIEIILKDADTISAANEIVELDEAFDIESIQIEEDVKKFVETQYSRYCAQLQDLLDTYGISSEGELFSGHFSKLNYLLQNSGGDNDDLSLFNATGIVHQRLAELCASFRTSFFDYFPAGQSYLEASEKSRISFYSAEILGQVCNRPTPQMCDVAVAYYNIAYKSSSNRYLSFPWIFWDVLAFVKQRFIVQNNIKLPVDSLGEKLTKHIICVINSKDPEIKNKCFNLTQMFFTNEWQPICQYLEIYTGLPELLLFVMLWSEQHALNIHPLKLCALCIGINNGAVNPDIENFSPLFSPEMLGESESINLMLRVGSLGRCLATLLSALSSNKLQSLPSLTISIADSPFSFSKDELLSVRDAALTTVYHLTLTDTQYVLPQPTSAQNPFFSPIIEGHPILIEMTSQSLDKCLEALQERAKKMGCVYVATRVLSKLPGQNRKISLVAKGTLQQIRAFYNSLAVTPKASLTPREQYSDMAKQVCNSLFSG